MLMSIVTIKSNPALGVRLDQSQALPGFWINVQDALGNWHSICYSPSLILAEADYLYIVEILKIRGPRPVIRSSPMEQSR